MKKFEYIARSLIIYGAADILNKYGEGGWEVCGLVEDKDKCLFYMKRELKQEETNGTDLKTRLQEIHNDPHNTQSNQQ